MKYFIIILSAFLLVCVALKFILPDSQSDSFNAAIKYQQNPFTVPKDSADIVWARGRKYLLDSRNSVKTAGGRFRENDTLLYIPYRDSDYPDNQTSYHKGTSILIHRKDTAGSAQFSVEWYYSQTEQEPAERELAYYMATGKSYRDAEFRK